MQPSNRFTTSVRLSIPPVGAEPLRRWLNLQHEPELGGAAPEVGRVRRAHMDAAHRLHMVQEVAMEVEASKDGGLRPVAVVHGGKRYLLVEEGKL